MRISIISFTSNGVDLSIKIKELADREQEVTLYTKSSVIKQNITSQIHKVEEKLSEWTKEKFQECKALVFIGACGIAVRAIAPFVKNKLLDPPVLVIDEAGRFVIPILSGHYGGANELAQNLADKLGAAAVITTATDVNKLFAVDVFARKNSLHICNREGIEKVSAAVLNKDKVSIAISGEIKGVIPKELTVIDYPVTKVSILVSPFKDDGQKADLQLCPKAYVVGIGCRRNKSYSELEAEVKKQIERIGVRGEAIMAFASIDRKKDEEGLISLASHYNLPFLTFTEENLKALPGEFTSSAFVEEQVGVDNVCERAAMAACGENGKLILGKQAENGITIAIAERKWSVTFDET
ncbi:MAG: cobalt-precorrin 5A hydrolase [Mobilitalea sp.]